MRRVTRSVLPAVAISTLILGTACSGASTPTGVPAVNDPAPSAESVAWTDKVCGVVRPFVDVVTAGPQVAAAESDASAAVAGLSSFFGRSAAALDGTIAGLGTVGPSPVPAGNAIVTKMTQDYTGLRTSLLASKSKVDAIDVADTEGLATALPAAIQGLPETFDPKVGLRTDPQLGRAVDVAASCTALPSGPT